MTLGSLGPIYTVVVYTSYKRNVDVICNIKAYWNKGWLILRRLLHKLCQEIAYVIRVVIPPPNLGVRRG